MVVCRECERLLLRTPPTCPSCRAERPGARLRQRRRRRLGLRRLGSWRLAAWLLVPALSAPALVAGDAAARWLLAPG